MVSAFLASLNGIHAELDIVWPEGREPSCCDKDGRHYAMKGYPRPVSIGQVEAHLLYNLAVSGHVTRAFEVGTGFGYSSFWLGAAINRNSPTEGWLGSMDDHSEGAIGARGLHFAASGARRLGLERTIDYIVGASPVDTQRHIVSPINLAFIDGAHKAAQPRADYMAIRDSLSESAFLIWHDVRAEYDVADGVSAAITDGWFPIVFPTSCRLCVCYRHIREWDIALYAFDHARALSLL